MVDQQFEQEKPPLFSSWRTWYAIVLGNLVLVIVLFYFFMKTFE